ncbi:Inositol-1-monophosphatase [Roseibacterium elongatum DSM 19469]|uniref:Inositol-1-monophosphatase n=2 Tax=Roseicyclus elongatus TaxID=159346 RepID=W8RSV0_9RHOB|nr:Inositol-1-monophosphatase [Roseibacterium elongatum DSM 19469]
MDGPGGHALTGSAHRVCRARFARIARASIRTDPWQALRARLWRAGSLRRIETMQGSANLNVMIKTARKAARSLVKDFREVENLQVSSKGPGDFVSRADRAAEEIIRSELMEARPNYGFLGEEGTEIEGKDPTRRWIVDPLDGTTNFLHGMPHWAVSIALEHKGEIVAGVVYDPAKDEMFYAEKGAGAWLNDSQRLRVSGRNRLIESVFATGVPFGGGKYLPATLQDLARLMPTCAGVRRWGSAALDLAYVAAGRYDGYWERGLDAWDVAAGILLVKEAGGLVQPIREGQDVLTDGHVLAASEPIFDSFSKIIRDRGD